MEQSIETIDLRYYLSVLQKWRLVIVLVTIISVLTAGFLSFFVLPPVYETQVTLMVSTAGIQRMTQYQPDDLRSMVGIMSRLPEMTINTYVGQLTSAYFMSRVAKQLRLDPDIYTPLAMARLIQAKAIKDTNLIEIQVNNNDPKLATAMANTISTEFIDFITENLQAQMAKSVRFLEEQAEQANKELVQANGQLRQVQVGLRGVEFLDRELKGKSQALSDHLAALLRTKIEEQSLAAGLDSITRELDTVPKYIQTREAGTRPAQEWNPAYRQAEQQLKDKKVALAEKQAYLDQILKPGGSTQVDVPRLRAEIDALAAGIAVLSSELASTPKFVILETGSGSSEQALNPLWQSLVQQQRDKIIALAEKSALRSGYEASVAQLTQEINGLQSALAEKRTEEYRLAKQVSQLEQAHSLLGEKIIQTQMTRSMNIGEANISIVAPAVQPVLPVRPRKALNCAVAGILGLIVSIGLAFVLEYIDYTIKSPDDVVRYLGVPSLGSVPVISGERRSTGGDE